MVGISDAQTIGARQTAPRLGDAVGAVRGPALAALPTLVAAALLLIASWANGAFQLRSWGPLAIFALVALAVSRGSGVRGPAVGMAVAMWVFAGWSALSVLWADVPSAALEGGARNALYAALVSLPLLTLPDRAWAVRTAKGLTAGLGALVLGTLIACLTGGADHFLAGRLDDPVGYRNGTAALFALAAWPLICVAAQRRAHALIRALSFALALAAVGLAYLTQSRGVVVGFALGGVVALALGPDRLRRAWLAILAVAGTGALSHKLLAPYDAFLATSTTVPDAVDRAVTALAALTAAGFVVALLLCLVDGGLRVAGGAARNLRVASGVLLVLVSLVAAVGAAARIGDPVAFVKDKAHEFKQLDVAAPGESRLGSTSGQRYDLWRIAWAEFRSAPLIGVGESSYAPGYYARRATDRNVSTPHSLAASTLAETGLVGALALAGMLVAALLALIRGWKEATPDERRWASGLTAAGVVLIGQSLVDWLWLIPGLTGLGLLCLAVGVATVSLPREPAPPRARAWSAVRVVPVVAAVLVACVFLADLEIRTARAEAATATPQRRIALADKAARYDPVSLEPHYLRAGALEEEHQRAAARRELLDALDREPGSFVTMALLGDLETRAGHTAAARTWYRRALAANPRDVGLQQLAAR
jgi:O-Antigen ligase